MRQGTTRTGAAVVLHDGTIALVRTPMDVAGRPIRQVLAYGPEAPMGLRDELGRRVALFYAGFTAPAAPPPTEEKP